MGCAIAASEKMEHFVVLIALATQYIARTAASQSIVTNHFIEYWNGVENTFSNPPYRSSVTFCILAIEVTHVQIVSTIQMQKRGQMPVKTVVIPILKTQQRILLWSYCTRMGSFITLCGHVNAQI
jgi:hypothetical protein